MEPPSSDDRKPQASPEINNSNNNNNNNDNNKSHHHEPTTPSRAAAAAKKPALKKEDHPHASSSSSSSEKKHLKWDEKAIEEHDLLRGTRMKIDEPNTPYTHYDSGNDEDSAAHSDGSLPRPKSPAHQRPTLQWDVLQTRLDSVAAVRDAYPSSPSAGGETDHSDVEEERKKEMRHMEFKEHRKRHYNEMEAVRRFRQEHGDFALDDDDEEGDADDETEKK